MSIDKIIQRLQWFLDYNEEDFCGGDRIVEGSKTFYYVSDEDLKAFKEAIELIKENSCKDAINREDTLKTIIKHLGIRSEEYLLPAEEAIYKIVKNMPPVTPTQRWIPVSEGMPNEFADVICCTEAKEVFIATYLGKMNDGTDCFDDHDGMMWEGDIIAWMPLPEPYKAEREK